MCGVDNLFRVVRVEADVGVALVVGKYQDDVWFGRYLWIGSHQTVRCHCPDNKCRTGFKKIATGHNTSIHHFS
jgi:hypothetical protein